MTTEMQAANRMEEKSSARTIIAGLYRTGDSK